MSSPTTSAPYREKDGASTHEDEDEELSSEDGEAGPEDGMRKRKRASTTTTRPMSSCEYKERKKPGLRAGYGRELEARLDKLEGVLRTQQTVLQQLVQHLPHGLVVPPEVSYFGQTSNGYPSSVPTEHAVIGSQVAGHVTQQTSHLKHASASSIRMPAITPSVNGYEPSQPPLESPSLNIAGATPDLAASENDAGNIDSLHEQDLPPYELLYALTDLFFKHINTWCPILHRRTTLDSLFGPTALDEADRILLHAIVATTLRFSTDRLLSEPVRERYHSISKQKVLLYGMENSSVKALQALVILALDIVGSSNGPPGWNLLALITRSVVQLGLSVETTSSSVAPVYPSIYTLRAMVLPEAKSFIEDESRRRLFWMVYLLDRYAMIATAFEFALDEKEIDRKLPCRDDLLSRNQFVETRWFRGVDRTDYSVDRPENLGSFSYYIEIVGILSQIHRFLKNPVDIGALSDVEQWQREYRQLDTRLNSWKFSLPHEYGNESRLFNSSGGNKIVDCIWIMLHVTYHTTVIRLHSSAAYPTTRSPIFTPSFSASQRCLTAVEDICSLCSCVRINDMLDKLGPPFAFSLWVAARLLLVHGSTIDHQVNPAIGLLVETLRELGIHWKVAERYATLLQRVLDEYHDSERAPVGADGRRETPSTVRILADMRRCAYDLDFLISRQPRPSSGAKTAAFTPARTPAPNELEYLDVFDFFNMPRLPVPAGSGGGDAGVTAQANANGDVTSSGQAIEAGANNEFNITNFMFDVNADWFGNAET